MKRKTAGRVHHQRECFYCKGGIAEQRPVFLVADSTGQIVGPFHAGCAEKLKLHAARGGVSWDGEHVELFGFWPTRREETLPW